MVGVCKLLSFASVILAVI